MSEIKKPMYAREEMGRLVKWFFGLPLMFVIHIFFSLFMPRSTDSPRMVFVFNIVSYIVFIAVAIVVITRFLKFSFRKMLSFGRPFSVKNLAIGFSVMLVLCLGTSFLWKALRPDTFEFTLQQGWPVDFALSLALVILAAFLEEILCRAYVAYFVKDELEKRPKQTLFYCLASAALFTILHFQNPEVHGSGAVYAMVFYFIMGFALMAIYLKTGGIEASLGIHIANNLVSAWFFTYGNSVLKTNAIFTQSGEIGPLSLVQAVFCTAVSSVIVLVCLRKAPSTNSAEKL
ncbi:MAG: CPBP family intramembrane metalloprotease [Spirochaetales bacterium]|nr:CPBP family intramembrane metalloprotease [Spirochaetales bacterium]